VTAPSAFGSYRVLHQIGSGVLGPVFRCYGTAGPDRATAGEDTLFAVKALKVDLVPEDAARLADTLRTLADRPDIDPAIVTPVDAGVEGTTPYLVYEYESGDALDVFLRQSGGLTLAQAQPLIDALAQAIDTAWDHGVGHGSLHPRDIFIGSNLSHVRISGFGVAQALESVGFKAPCRRPYAAPERVSASSWDRRADIYALAAIVQELLSKQGKETGDSWRSILATAMAESPDDRFSRATDFAEELSGSPIIASPQPAMDLVDESAPLPAPAPVELGTAPSMDEMRRDISAPPAPAIDLSSRLGLPPPAVVVTHGAFPWGATLAVAAAGIALGVVGGYELGYRRAQATLPASAPLVAAAPSPSPSPTPTPTPTPTPAEQAVEPVVTPPPAVVKPEPTRTAPPPKTRTARPAAALPGSIDFDTRPRGASVTVDGRPRGLTPLVVKELSPGVHSVLIRLAGHRPVSGTVSVVAGEQTRWAVSLEQIGFERPGRY
jgi:serine/threonine protein kinase